jgi:hypothetical protein
MRKFISILFLIFFSVTSTEAGQLFKIPILIRHYLAHKEINNNTSFVHFIKQHYAVQHDRDGDDDKDSQLPFKSMYNPELSATMIIPLASEEVFLDPVAVKLPGYIQPFFLKNALQGVFHPPRVFPFPG